MKSVLGASGVWSPPLKAVPTKLRYLQFSTEEDVHASDSLAESTEAPLTQFRRNNFIGLHIGGGSLDVRDCRFAGFSDCGLEVYDLGYAHIENCTFQGNRVGLHHSLRVWKAGTTATFRRCMGFGNAEAVFDVPDLNHSTWEYCIFEGNGYGVKLSRQCDFIRNYAEGNRNKAIEPGGLNPTTGTLFASGVVFDNFENSEFDQFANQRPPNAFSTAGAVVTSRLKQAVPNNNGELMGQIVGFTTHNNVIQNAFGSFPERPHTDPESNSKGWRFTQMATGVYEIDFRDSYRPLHCHVEAMDPDGDINNNNMQRYVALIAGKGPNFNGFGNANSVRIETFRN